MLVRDIMAHRNCRHALVLIGLMLIGPIATAADFVYRVERGDTLAGIGKRNLVDPSLWRKVARYNRLRNPNLIRPGQELRIPLDWLKRVATSAEIVDVSGHVAVRAKAAPVPAQPGTRLEPGAEVTTGADSFVTL